jgi:hypothetical protein
LHHRSPPALVTGVLAAGVLVERSVGVRLPDTAAA